MASKNRNALESVEEAGEELIALNLLEAPSSLQVSLLSTSAVKNPIRNFRAKTRRVTRWRPQSDMTERWTAYAMLTVEQGFQRISGCQDLPVLLRALGWTEENMTAVAGTISPIRIGPTEQSNGSVSAGGGSIQWHENNVRIRGKIQTGNYPILTLDGTSPHILPRLYQPHFLRKNQKKSTWAWKITPVASP